ncbi:uncharacterized protein LOC113554175 isoform X4 [Rhopalosiphum maidis]|uniref:uncharacterized protein LOC113554175 isoform X4 n=1 Tax=Rhopalosiphum maidis TaxID=43146 RepID=UPI000EFF38EB|nr:uncharacterized protein LOC113554175 isoform X4 [Rhopalosiphum maidis]
MKEHRTKGLRVTTTESIISDKNDTMTEGAEGCSDDPLASLQLDVASGGPSSESQQPESQAEVSTLCISSADNDIDKIIAGEWHGGECKTGCCSRCAFREWRLVGDKLQLFCFKDYDALIATRPAIANIQFCFRFKSSPKCLKHPNVPNANCFIFFDIVSGDIHKNWMQVVRRLKETSANATVAQLRRWSQAVDENGNTALILGAKRLMNCGLFKRAYQFAVMMLKFGSDVNWLNNGGRSLITYTVHYMDQAIDITRLLLNCGATVWLEDCNSEARLHYVQLLKEYRTKTETDLQRCLTDDPIESPLDSIFTWFLRSVMIRRRMDDSCLRTLSLLSQSMGEDPTRMHSHVMRTMFSHAQCYNIFGPVFFQIKKALAPQWVQPHSLQQLCRKSIRRSLFRGRHGNAHPDTVAELNLPKPLESYVSYHD